MKKKKKILIFLCSNTVERVIKNALQKMNRYTNRYYYCRIIKKISYSGWKFFLVKINKKNCHTKKNDRKHRLLINILSYIFYNFFVKQSLKFFILDILNINILVVKIIMHNSFYLTFYCSFSSNS